MNFFWTCLCLGHMPRSRIHGLEGTYTINFARLHIVLQTGCSKYILTSSKESPYSSTSSLTWKSQTSKFLPVWWLWSSVSLSFLCAFSCLMVRLSIFLYIYLPSGFLLLAYNLSLFFYCVVSLFYWVVEVLYSWRYSWILILCLWNIYYQKCISNIKRIPQSWFTHK